MCPLVDASSVRLDTAVCLACFSHLPAWREADRQTDRQTKRQKERHRDRQTEGLEEREGESRETTRQTEGEGVGGDNRCLEGDWFGIGLFW